MGQAVPLEIPKNLDPFDFKSSGLHGKVYGGLFLVVFLLIGLLFWQGHRVENLLSATNTLLQNMDGTQKGFNSTIHDLAQAVRDLGR